MFWTSERTLSEGHSSLVAHTSSYALSSNLFISRQCRAVPRGLCAILINALKLSANQQEVGDGLFQNIVKDLGKESREGLTDALREFIKVDNERALDVGSVSRGTRTFQVRKPKVPEGARM